MIVSQLVKNSDNGTSELDFLSSNLSIRIPTNPCPGKMNTDRMISSYFLTIYFSIIILLRALHLSLPNSPFRASSSLISLESISE